MAFTMLSGKTQAYYLPSFFREELQGMNVAGINAVGNYLRILGAERRRMKATYLKEKSPTAIRKILGDCLQINDNGRTID